MKNRQSSWSFNHRNRVHEASDSPESSDPESQAETKTNIPSDDSRLLQLFDISSRHETVEYKPNPWSIAKINAASRAPNTKERSEDFRRKSHPRAPQGRIVDAFKVQAARKPPHSPVPSKALKVARLKSKSPQVYRQDRRCTQGKSSVEPGEYSQLANAPFLNSVSPSGPERTPVLSSAPQEDVRDLQFQPSPHVQRSSWSSDNEHGGTSEPALQPCVAHISTSATPAILLSSALQEDLPRHWSQHHLCVLTPSCAQDSEGSDISAREEPTLRRDIAHISTSDTLGPPQSRCNVPFLSRSSPPIGSDYPLHASSLRSEGYQSSPPRPSHRSVYSHQRLLPRTPVNQSFSHRRDLRVTGNQHLRASMVSTAPRVPVKDSHPITRPKAVEIEPSTMPQWLISTMHNSLNPLQAQSELTERGLSSVPLDDGTVSPELRKCPRRSPTRSPSYQRAQRSVLKRNTSPPPAAYIGLGVSAYTFEADPDANWSTITQSKQKKVKSFMPTIARSSGPFRLPAPAVGNPKGESKGITKTEKKHEAKRRVITYLPPPPSRRTVTSSEIQEVEVYHAPGDDICLLGSAGTAQPLQESDLESSLVQADSDDLTLVDEVDEQVLVFDAREVKRQYPKVRKLAKETRVKLPELLGLPSCGVVWRDDGLADADAFESGNREIKISTWPCIR